MIGRSLGPYRILEPLGSGGMGEVYLAEDTRLHRRVALKLLPPRFARDAERLSRFEQEARAAAALNHPHIAAVYDVGAASVDEGPEPVTPAGGRRGLAPAGSTPGPADAPADDDSATTSHAGPTPVLTHFIVQEYLEGEALRLVVERGALPLDHALELGAEIAEGLAAAHRAGIVHRDLKPENVFVTVDGHAKILDFGLAKLFEPEAAGAPEDEPTGADVLKTASPTVLGTSMGQVMGTVGYMAPEQIAGRKVDRRADIFAFGCLLYEMVTGERPFQGGSVHETLHKIGHVDFEPVYSISPGLPPQLQWIIAKCLAKRPERRYQSADELVVDLRNLARDVESGVVRIAPPGPAAGAPTTAAAPGVPLPIAIVGGLVLATVAVIVTSMSLNGGGATAPPRAGREFPIGLDRFLSVGMRDSLALSADGNKLVFGARDAEGLLGLFLHDLEANATSFIRGTEGGDLPFFSPDGEWIGFYDGNDGLVKKVSLEGGDPFPLGSFGFVPEGAWGPEDEILLANGDLQRVDAGGGDPETLFEETDEVGLSDPAYLPGGRAALVVARARRADPAESPPGIAVFVIESRELRPLIADGVHPQYLPGGQLVYARGSALYAVPFDALSLRVTGEARLVRQGVRGYSGLSSEFATADDGTLVYVPGEAIEQGRMLVRATLDGHFSPLGGEGLAGAATTGFDVASDGRRVAAVVPGPADPSSRGRGFGNTRIQVVDLARGGASQILADSGTSPLWSPDDAWVYFVVRQRDPRVATLYRKRPGSTTEPERVRSLGTNGSLIAFAPRGADGNRALVSFGERGFRTDSLGWVSLADEEAPEPIIEGVNAWRAALSSDGRLLAFDRRDADALHVSVLDLSSGLIHAVGPGFEPRWAPDGHTLYYLDGTWVLGAEVSTDQPFDVGTPQVLFFHPAQLISANFEVDPAGNGFLMLVRPDQAQGNVRPQIRVVVDWGARLRLPTR